MTSCVLTGIIGCLGELILKIKGMNFEDTVNSIIKYTKDCESNFFDWLFHKGERPTAGCLTFVVLVDCIIIIIVFGAGYFISGDISVFSDFFEWMFSFLTEFASYLQNGFFGFFNIFKYFFSYFYELSNYIAKLTNSNETYWKVITTLSISLVITEMIKNAETSVSAWMNTYFYDIFNFLNTPVKWLFEKIADNAGYWFAVPIGILMSPFEIGILLVSFLLGGIAYPLIKLYNLIMNSRNVPTKLPPFKT